MYQAGMRIAVTRAPPTLGGQVGEAPLPTGGTRVVRGLEEERQERWAQWEWSLVQLQGGVRLRGRQRETGLEVSVGTFSPDGFRADELFEFADLIPASTTMIDGGNYVLLSIDSYPVGVDLLDGLDFSHLPMRAQEDLLAEAEGIVRDDPSFWESVREELYEDVYEVAYSNARYDLQDDSDFIGEIEDRLRDQVIEDVEEELGGDLREEIEAEVKEDPGFQAQCAAAFLSRRGLRIEDL